MQGTYIALQLYVYTVQLCVVCSTVSIRRPEISTYLLTKVQGPRAEAQSFENVLKRTVTYTSHHVGDGDTDSSNT